jgi:hypothetical protein
VTIVAGRPEGFDVPDSRWPTCATTASASTPCAVAAYINAEGQIEELVLDDPDETRLPVEMVYVYRRPTPRNELAMALGVE